MAKKRSHNDFMFVVNRRQCKTIFQRCNRCLEIGLGWEANENSDINKRPFNFTMP